MGTQGTVIGLDPSLTGLAVCRFGDADVSMATVGEDLIGPEWSQRCERYRRLASKAVALIGETGHPVFLESYSFGSRMSHAHQAGEFGCYLRLKLTQSCRVPIVEVTPKELKKFVAGNGNANKAMMVSAVSLRLGRPLIDDNQADAYGLAWIGRCVLELDEPSNADRRNIVREIRKRHVQSLSSVLS